MDRRQIHSVGLGGDGDEIHAIEDVEEAFGVRFDASEASGWVTAGDVFRSLQRADNNIGAGEWLRFACALSGQTGIDPALITPESPLLSEDGIWRNLASISAGAWIITATLIAALVTIAALA